MSAQRLVRITLVIDVTVPPLLIGVFGMLGVSAAGTSRR
jgi:hypothetical protein